jgi:GntR family transcriptional repressor for pyruvate dehydrogenase complex
MKTPFKVRKTYEEVADYLRNQIVSGVYKPGERLPSLRELGEMLGVGQSTIREAIGSLKTMGLVSIRQGEGTFVTQFEPEELLAMLESIRPVTKQDIISLLEVRKIIESGIVRLAAERRTEEDLQFIKKAVEELEEAHRSDIRNKGDQADWEFHFAIANASHNEILVSMMHSISEIMKRTMKLARQKIYEMPGVPERLLQEHLDIYKAIESGNGEQAEKMLLDHLRRVETIMVEQSNAESAES